MLDWLIVGGGVHGTHLSLSLVTRQGVPKGRIRVLDPHDAPLARWDACTANTAMTFLRSPFVHHLGLEPFALDAFARSREGRSYRAFTGPNKRPALDFFQAHARAVVSRHGLSELRILGKATGLGVCPGGIRVETPSGSLKARRVLLAMGASDQPAWPPWARALRERGAPIDHIFDPGFERVRLPPWSHAIVLGGGISAAQAALALAHRAPGTVTLLARHAPRVHPFDTDPGWMGPARLDGFARVRDTSERRRLIRMARHPGSMPPDVASLLRRALASRTLERRTAGVRDGKAVPGGIQLDLDDRLGPLFTDRIVLATGFDAARPGGAWIDRAVADLGLACGACGYPIVDASLRWHPGIYVTGPLAELELGPPARNIHGARMAAERLAVTA